MPRKANNEITLSSDEFESINSKLQAIAAQTKDDSFLLDENESSIETVKLVLSERMSKSLKGVIADVKNPSRELIKLIVNVYYEQQKSRIALNNRIRAIQKGEYSGSQDILEWFMRNNAIIEVGCKDAHEVIVNNSEVGRWLMQIQGIGPVIAAGLLAYFDVTGKQYPSAFIEYAGWNDNNHPFIGRVGAEKLWKELMLKYDNPRSITDEMVIDYASMTKVKFARFQNLLEEGGKWSKEALIKEASKIPYNKSLKSLLWKAGRSFIMQCNNKKSLYGRRYAERKILETERNNNGEYAEQARLILQTKNFSKDTVAYSEYIKGRLPKKHIEMRAMRYAVKAFIVHVFEEMYRVKYDKLPPLYYPLVHCEGHKDVIRPEVPYTMTSEEKVVGHYLDPEE